MSRQYYTLEDGSLVYIGPPPIPLGPDGYEQDPEHKELFRPIWEECAFRTTKPFRCPNGRITNTPYCSVLDQVTTYQKCSSCTLPKTK